MEVQRLRAYLWLQRLSLLSLGYSLTPWKWHRDSDVDKYMGGFLCSEWVRLQLLKSQVTLFEPRIGQGFRLLKKTWLIGVSPNRWSWVHLDLHLDSSFKDKKSRVVLLVQHLAPRTCPPGLPVRVTSQAQLLFISHKHAQGPYATAML